MFTDPSIAYARCSARLLFCLGTATFMACGDESDPCAGFTRTYLAHAKDSLGNPLDIDSAALVHGRERIACKIIAGQHASASCEVNHAGDFTLEYSVEGVAGSYELDADWASNCNARGSIPVELVYDGPRCDVVSTAIVQGSLLDADGEAPVNTTVYVRAENGKSVDCEVDGAGDFSCPAVDPTSTQYTVYANFPFTGFSQQVEIDVSACHFGEPARADFDLSSWACEGDADPAARVFIHTKNTQTGELLNALADTVTAHSTFTQAEECVLEDAPSSPGPRAYVCPSRTRFGSGTYTFEATRNGEVVTKELVVSSFNCQARTTNVDISFDL